MQYYQNETYTQLGLKVIDERMPWIKTADVRIAFCSSTKEKKRQGRETLGECVKVSDLYKTFIPYDFIIIIYDPNCVGLTEAQMEVLMYHELKHVGVNEKNGEPEYRIIPHDVEDFRDILEQYGLGWNRR